MSKTMNATFATTYAAFVAEAARNGFAVTLVPLTPAKQPKAAATPKAQPKAESKPAAKAKPKASKSGTKLYARYCDAVGIEYPEIDAEYRAAKQPLTRKDGKQISASTKCYWHYTQHLDLLGHDAPLSYAELDASL